jgi:hypothetical protein
VFSIHVATFIQHFVQQTVKVDAVNAIEVRVVDVLHFIVERRFEAVLKAPLQSLRR